MCSRAGFLHLLHVAAVSVQGTKRVERLEENVAAFALQLTAADLEELDNAFPHDVAAGYRCEYILAHCVAPEGPP